MVKLVAKGLLQSIVSMSTGTITDAILNFDGHGIGTCKQTFKTFKTLDSDAALQSHPHRTLDSTM